MKLALVEDDGSVSVLRREWAEPAMKADVDQQAATQRMADTGGKEKPGDATRTDAPEWLK